MSSLRLLPLTLVLSLAACFDPSASGDEGESGSTGDDSTGTPSSSATDSATSQGPTASTDPTDPTAPTSSDPTSTTDPTSATESETGSEESTSTSAADDASSSTGSEVGPGCSGFDGRVVYVNMDGAELTVGIVDNAPARITSFASMVGTWPGYTTDDADALFEAVLEHWAPFHVCLTREEPQVDDYSMIVVSSETYQDPNFIGFGHIDCGDVVPNSVNVVVLSAEAGLGLGTKAVGLSKHIAHMFGLESVINAPDDLMNQYVGTTLNGATFTDTCYQTTEQHNCNAAVRCAAGEQQSGPYLEGLLGPAGG